jgi:hypothetical protein
MKYPGHLLSLGSKDPVGVRNLKSRLNQLGYSPLDPDNPTFGEQTAKNVLAFQELNQLYPDAVVGELTWERLFNKRANRAISSKILRYRALEYANSQLFVRERTGKNDGAEVKLFLKSVGLGEGYAWCQAFVYWCFEQAAIDLGIVNPIPKTAGVLECYRRAKAAGVSIIHDNPQEGDQFIMDFGSGKGHTGLVEFVEGDKVFTVEGNTNDGGSRDGDGCYERSRFIRSVKCFIRYE